MNVADPIPAAYCVGRSVFVCRVRSAMDRLCVGRQGSRNVLVSPSSIPTLPGSIGLNTIFVHILIRFFLTGEVDGGVLYLPMCLYIVVGMVEGKCGGLGTGPYANIGW